MNEAHGSFTIALRGNIMVFQAFGAWNKENKNGLENITPLHEYRIIKRNRTQK